MIIGSGARERAALPVKTPIGHTSATGLAAYNVADDKELQTTDLLHEGWMPGEPSRCQDPLSEFQRTSEHKETSGQLLVRAFGEERLEQHASQVRSRRHAEQRTREGRSSCTREASCFGSV